MKKFFLTYILACFVFSHTLLAFGENPQPSEWTGETNRIDRMIHKLGFGLLNITMGWTAVPLEINNYASTNPITGALKGSWRTLTNTVGGLMHTLTFPSPVDYQLPDGGVQFSKATNN